MSYISISMLLLLYSEGTSTLAAFCYFCIHAYMQNCCIKKKRWGPSLQSDYEGWMIAVPIYGCYTPTSLKFGTASGDLAAEVGY